MQPQKPLEGAQLVIMTIALSLATFMQVLDSHHRQRGYPHDCR
ncbi:Multidrug resistance protein B [Kluyvera cryocrescens]|uniref:Multidrug resistance protein B n=1 Tax=Kluyvera cryocrescens TaxID=580 RepID=A0A485ARR8_KLUCR|nr:Multidrug resistance protein B [Kluyvera cryocrescens]